MTWDRRDIPPPPLSPPVRYTLSDAFYYVCYFLGNGLINIVKGSIKKGEERP